MHFILRPGLPALSEVEGKAGTYACDVVRTVSPHFFTAYFAGSASNVFLHSSEQK